MQGHKLPEKGKIGKKKKRREKQSPQSICVLGCPINTTKLASESCGKYIHFFIILCVCRLNIFAIFRPSGAVNRTRWKCFHFLLPFPQKISRNMLTTLACSICVAFFFFLGRQNYGQSAHLGGNLLKALPQNIPATVFLSYF